MSDGGDEHVVKATEPAWVEGTYKPDANGAPEWLDEPRVGDGIDMLMDESTYECSCGADLAYWGEVEEHFRVVTDE